MADNAPPDVKKPSHLNDLFHAGEEVDIEVFNPEDPDNPLTFPVWMRKPTVGQQEEARAKANAMQHRRKRKFKDKEGDAWISMWEQSIEPLESKTELIDAIVGYDEAKLRSQAYNEVLFGDEGSDWGENGSRLLGSLDAVQTRMAEIERHNDTLDEGDEDLIIQYGEDQELLDLQAEYASFDTETAERLDALMDRERAKFEGKKLAELRAALTKRIVDLEGDMAWYQEYRIRMLFHACRKMESRKEHYFNDMEDILELPSPVQSQLMMALDQIDRGGDAKNSDSLLESLV